ncbi:MAG: aminoacetone oxidase family FAD-binding enzyme [Patescibacteria group bacterium]
MATSQKTIDFITDQMNNQFGIIVIGGGPSGMMAAGRAAERGRRVLLLEKNKHLGAKLALTGNGRCNITNAQEDQRLLLGAYGKEGKFLFSPFSQFGMKDTFSFFAARGLPLVVEEDFRAFPKSQKATDVIRVMQEYMQRGQVVIKTGVNVHGLISGQGIVRGVNVGGKIIEADAVVLATGGTSHPETGSTGDGWRWLAKLGHTIHRASPTVVPLAVREKWVKSLAGVSLNDVKISFFLNSQREFSLAGRILCTHFGLSGPLILNAAGKVSELLRAGPVTAAIDVYPKLDAGNLDTFCTKLFDNNKNKALKNMMKQLTPVGTAEAIMSLLPRVLPEKKVHSISRDERKALVRLLKALPLSISGLMGNEWAVVADGGLPVGEVEGKTMRSRRYSNLFVTGDLLHITRPSGGYSLQLCWTTGYVAGSHA